MAIVLPILRKVCNVSVMTCSLHVRTSFLAALFLANASCGGDDSKSSEVQNQAPQFTSTNKVRVDDDTAGVIYAASASDPDNDRLTYSVIGGVDGGAFRITGDGQLSFHEPANYEAPADQNRDNVYHLKLQVSDGRAAQALDLEVNVQNTPVPTENLPPWTLLGQALWQGRDSAGEATLNGRKWIMGGWVSSFEPALRDVWSSTDGYTWRRDLIQAPWTHSDLPMSIAFNGRLWMMGGYDQGRLPGATASSQVWSSPDGIDWTAHADAPWSARLGSAVVIHQEKMWIIGGLERYFDGSDESLRNDVWTSTDGEDWTLVLRNAPWSPRAFHNAVSLNGRIYVFGGGNYVPSFAQSNDVWSSADGASWRRETALAEWPPRIWASATVHAGRMWLLGGYSRGDGKDPETVANLNDVWTSTDGARWTLMQSPEIWSPRHEMSVWVSNNRIYLGAGYDGNKLQNDVWSLSLP